MKKSSKNRSALFIAVFVQAALLICFSAFCAFYNVMLAEIGLILAVTELAVFAVCVIVSARKKAKAGKRFPVLNDITLDFLMQFVYPVVILDAQGKILWYNKGFSDKVISSTVLYDLNINEVLHEKFNMKLADIEKGDGKIRAFLGDNEYDVSSYTVSSGENVYYLTVWQDRLELSALERKVREKNPVICYIAIDNYLDNMNSRQTDYRTVTANIAIVLQTWASKQNAILREIERDRYIMIMEASGLAAVMENKFDILDAVRDATKNETDIPATISIGVANIDGSFPEKEAIAHTALDLALQRGGDQAVVKSRTETEFYGGRTKTVQKRTKIRSRIIAGELSSLMNKAENVLIMGHKYADYDSIGSCVGIARLAMEHCEKVNIVVNLNDVNLRHIFDKLRGLEDYRKIFIDSAAAQDLVGPDTLLIVCDVNNPAVFESTELYNSCVNVAIIDHHRKTGEFSVVPKIAYIEPSASSASELVAEILEQATMPGTLLKEEAELLFSGIILDTKQFTRNTGTRTFSAAFYLRSEGANPGDAQMLFKTDLREFLKEIKFENNVVIYRDMIAISVYDGTATTADKIAAAKAAERLLGVEGVLASFVLCMIDDTVHISARSTGSVNVQLILETLHGGGHFDSAGAQLRDMPMKTALSKLKEAIDDYLNQG